MQAVSLPTRVAPGPGEVVTAPADALSAGELADYTH